MHLICKMSIFIELRCDIPDIFAYLLSNGGKIVQANERTNESDHLQMH